jgi:1-pyrroline-5-carboxylate dehydrogenase
LVSGNAVIFKPASDTPLVGRLLADCFLESGLPDGALNFVTGPGGIVGRALAADPDVSGVTFTGSYEIGMGLYRAHPQGGCAYPRPCIVEMGGKNAAIVSRKANLEKATQGIFRSAFGLQGQKCSACSRIFVDRRVLDPFLERLTALTDAITIGDPSRRDVLFGPVINAKAYADFALYAGSSAAGDTSRRAIWPKDSFARRRFRWACRRAILSGAKRCFSRSRRSPPSRTWTKPCGGPTTFVMG